MSRYFRHIANRPVKVDRTPRIDERPSDGVRFFEVVLAILGAIVIGLAAGLIYLGLAR